MKKVTEKEYWDFIGPKDLVVRVDVQDNCNDYWEVRGTRVLMAFSKVISRKYEYPIRKEYYIKN